MQETIHIDDLFKQVRLVWKAAKPKKREEVVEAHASELYSNPDNWKATRALALIHRETDTLLGVFQELVHLKVPDARRLVRIEKPCSLHYDGTEYVSGSWYLPATDEARENQGKWHSFHDASIHAHLSELSIHAPECEVRVYTSFGSIARVELLSETTFASTEEGNTNLLTLPKGTCIYDLMTREEKCAVRDVLMQVQD